MKFPPGQIKTPLATSSILFLSLVSAYSGLLAYDSFSYTNDHNYYMDGGFGWGDAWGGLSVADGLTYSKNNRPLATQGGGAWLLIAPGRNLNTSLLGPFATLLDTNGLIGMEGSDIWVSFLLRPMELNKFLAGVWIGHGASSALTLYLTNGMNELAPGVPLALFTNYFVVEHIRFGTNNNDLREEYFNPVPGRSDPGGAQGTNIFLGSMSFNSVVLVGNSQVSLAGIVDELRFGESYADVSPLAPVTLTNIQFSAGTMAFSFQSFAGLSHTVETRPSFASGTWTDFTNFSGDGNLIQVTLPMKNSVGFFRIRTE
jgi:hypothetical protein